MATRSQALRCDRSPSRARRARWLDYDQAAQIAGITPRGIQEACSEGRLAFRLVYWRRRNFRRQKRLILDVDLLNWIYLRPHRLPQRKAWREPDAGRELDTPRS